MQSPSFLRRAAVVAAGAALLLAGGAAASAAGGPQPGTAYKLPSSANRALGAATVAEPVPGTDLSFVSVAPCRIIDTRVKGGPLTGQKTFDATMTSYASQGGKASTCNIPDDAIAVELNLGAISQKNKTSDVNGWATGTTKPLASLVNYNPSGPVANMVTLPIDPLGRFELATPGTAQIFADVAGYYAQPLYATIDALTDPLAPSARVSSGMVSVDTYKVNGTAVPGQFVLTFNRNVTTCVPAGTDYSFVDTHFISVDPTFLGLPTTTPTPDPNSILVQVKDGAGTPSGAIFHVSLTC